jgi:hypothetical protein
LLVNISRLGRRLVYCEARNKVVRGSKDSSDRGGSNRGGSDRGGSAIAGRSLVVVV